MDGDRVRVANLSKPVRELLGITNVLGVLESCGRDGVRMP